MVYGTIAGVTKPVARVIQGTVMLSGERLEQGYELLDGVLAAGGTTFDTAHGYAGGDADRVLGRWMEQRGNRDQVVVVGKGCHHNADRKRVTPYDLTGDLMDSLARLRTGFIDLYLLHRDDPEVPVAPIIDTLAEHQAAGRIGAYGGSNWSPQRIAAANQYAAGAGVPGFAASSPNYSLAVQQQAPWPDCLSISGTDAQADRSWYRERQLPLLVWSSLAGGFFSGRYRRDNLGSFTDYFDTLAAKTYGSEDNFRRLDAAERIATERGVSVAQVALAYVLGSGLNVFALVGSRSRAEFVDNAAAAALELSAAQLAALELRAA